MIVYGDAQRQTTLNSLLSELYERLAWLLEAAAPDADRLRSLLILAGQIEQAAEDVSEASTVFDADQRAAIRSLTEHAAAAFCADWLGEADAVYPALNNLLACWMTTYHLLENSSAESNALLTVKLPESYAFYTFYPEQSAMAGLRWLADHAQARPRHAIVIGVRSIGTSLAAVITTIITRGGWQVQRLSVRPTGHPFNRQVQLDRMAFGVVDQTVWGIVTDEGPGWSGSSMAAAAEALTRIGVARPQISLFTSHDGLPHGTSAEWVRAWWGSAPRYCTPLGLVRFGGRSLEDMLGAATAGLCDADAVVVQIDDLSGGLWRQAVYTQPEQWPPAYALFERTKYRITLRSGRRILWKFAGLSAREAEAQLQQLTQRAESGYGTAPLSLSSSFIATEWIDSEPLVCADANAELITQLGRYITLSTGLPLSAEEQNAAVERLVEMLYWNVWESLGEPTAERVKAWSALIRPALIGTPRTYGDGHLAPHEWRRVGERLIKLDGVGHDMDHTVVGRQAAAWDIAAAYAEWALTDVQQAALLTAYQAAGGEPITQDMLTFYRLAYLAFRVGLGTLCANGSAHDPAEQARLWAATAGYRESLARLITALAFS